jgi:hypothetical protein
LTITIPDKIIREILKKKLIRPDIDNIDEILEILSVHLNKYDAYGLHRLMFALLGIIPTSKYRIGDHIKVYCNDLHSWNITEEKMKKWELLDANNCVDCIIEDINVYEEKPLRISYKGVLGDEEPTIKVQNIKESSVFNVSSIQRPDLSDLF